MMTDKTLSGWGRNKFVKSKLIQIENENLSKELFAEGVYIARGLGRSYGDAALTTFGTTLIGAGGTNFKIDLKSGIIEAGASSTFDSILIKSMKNGFFLPVTPGTRFITVGGAIAADVHGKNHHKVGSFGNFVLEIKLLTPSGEIVCNRDQNSELFWATIGGMGLTGIIISAKFKLIRIETPYIKTKHVIFNDLDTLLEFLIMNEHNYTYSVAWVDFMSKGSKFGRSVVLLGEHAIIRDLPANSVIELSRFKNSFTFRMTRTFKFSAIQPWNSRIFNNLWFNFLRYKPQSAIVSIEKFFYPLDGIKNWNLLYGKNGFVQYQFALPTNEKSTLLEIFKELKDLRVPVYLSVLKQFGDSNSGLLSFPIKGWTLSLDIPCNYPFLSYVIQMLNKKVISGRGRVYLAKDSFLTSGEFRDMYVKANEFIQYRKRLDLVKHFESDLSRRLKI